MAKRKAAVVKLKIKSLSDEEKAEVFFKTMPVGVARKMLKGSSMFILHLMRTLGYPEERMQSSSKQPIDLNSLLEDIEGRLTRAKSIEIEFNRLMDEREKAI